MKKLSVVIGFLSLFLLACSSPMPNNPQSNNLPKAEVKNEVLPKPITSNSYISAEPLAGKKVKVSITAKDQDLYIANCNKAIAPALIEKGSEKIVWGGVSDACKSPDIVIKKGTNYGFIETINDKNSPLDLDKYYQVKILNLNDKLENPSSALSNAEKTSAVFKLLP